MTKKVINLDEVTHVVINGKEYERVMTSDTVDSPEGKCILLGLPLHDGQDKPTKDRPSGFKYFARIGSKFGGKPTGSNALRVDFYPKPDGVTTSRETDFAG